MLKTVFMENIGVSGTAKQTVLGKYTFAMSEGKCGVVVCDVDFARSLSETEDVHGVWECFGVTFRF